MPRPARDRPRVRGRWAVAGAAAALAMSAAVLSGCAGGAGASAPTWVPQPSFTGDGAGRGGSATPAPSDPNGSGGSSGQSGATGADPSVVATGLSAPVGLAVLPDGTALVGERTTGRIVQVQPQPGQPVTPVRTIGGLSTTGDGGLLDLAISPHYAQDELIYAYVTTPTDNRVVDFTLTGPVTPVLTGIPRGATHNGGRLSFDAAGLLYVGTGDVEQPALAASSTSLAGKVLRVTDVGQPATGNPIAGSPIFASGFQNVAALCYAQRQQTMFAVDGAHIDTVVGGGSYGWPHPGANYHPPRAGVPLVAPGASGCAVLQGALYLSTLDGQSLLSTILTGSGPRAITGPFSAALTKAYGRLRTVVAAADGALWLTTSNRDGHGTPGPADERVLRVLASSLGETSSPV